jgi:glycosyltransferase involved in cell wall biosynthesis
MTKLLIADQYGEMGGGQRVLLSILRAALRGGSEISVLAPGGGALQRAIAEEFGSRVMFFHCEEPRLTHGRKGISDVLAMLLYGWQFRRHKPLLEAQDVIYVNGLRHLPHLLLLSRGLKARMVYHIHIGHSRVEKLLLRLAARSRNTWRLVVNSRFIQQTLGISTERVCLIENALDVGFLDQPFQDRFTDRSSSAAVLGTVRPEKGQDIAMAVAAERPDLALHIIGREGDGAEEWITSLKRSAGPNIHFHGEVADPARAISQLGIQFNIVPSRWDEPFGLVAIEGMACSCLTIVSGRGGLSDIAEHTGALVAPDAPRLSALLDDLRARPASALAALARSQQARTLIHYAPARFEAQICALVKDAAAAKVR